MNSLDFYNKLEHKPVGDTAVSRELKNFAEIKCKEQDRNTRHAAIETVFALMNEYLEKNQVFPEGFASKVESALINQKIKLPEL